MRRLRRAFSDLLLLPFARWEPAVDLDVGALQEPHCSDACPNAVGSVASSSAPMPMPLRLPIVGEDVVAVVIVVVTVVV